MRQLSLLNYFFIASIILNAFLTGYIVSMIFKPSRPMPIPSFQRMGVALEQVSPQYRDQIDGLINKNRQDVRKSMIEVRENFTQIQPILTAQEFDIKKLEAIQNDLSREDVGMRVSMLSLMIEIAKLLPNEERIKFFEEFTFDRRRPSGRGPGNGRPLR